MLIEPLYNTLRFMFTHCQYEFNKAFNLFEESVGFATEDHPLYKPWRIARKENTDKIILACVCYAARQDDDGDYKELSEIMQKDPRTIWDFLVNSNVFQGAIGKVLWDESAADETLIVVTTIY